MLQSEIKPTVGLSHYLLKLLKDTAKGSLVFFSGGSALAEVSRLLARYSIPSVHLITPFDSGGSSAKLRETFNIPAVGDIRNRLLCLARVDVVGQALPELCALRFSKQETDAELRVHLKELATGMHAAMRKLEPGLREKVAFNFARVIEKLPWDFDLRGASVGNLLLVGSYLHYNDFNLAVEDFSSFLQIEGIVRPIISKNLHLAAYLRDGSLVVGQHLITGKEVPKLTSPIKEIFLTDSSPCVIKASDIGRLGKYPEKIEPYVSRSIEKYIASATAICFPMGSFYSSVLANLLPRGVGKVISRAECPKVYIPNVGEDPETLGLSVADLTMVLLDTLRKDAGADVPIHRLISHVFIDKTAYYPFGIGREKLKSMGITVAEMPLLDRAFSLKFYSPQLFLQALAELIAVEG